jgi:hypothetical protein
MGAFLFGCRHLELMPETFKTFESGEKVITKLVIFVKVDVRMERLFGDYGYAHLICINIVASAFQAF